MSALFLHILLSNPAVYWTTSHVLCYQDLSKLNARVYWLHTLSSNWPHSSLSFFLSLILTRRALILPRLPRALFLASVPVLGTQCTVPSCEMRSAVPSLYVSTKMPMRNSAPLPPVLLLHTMRRSKFGKQISRRDRIHQGGHVSNSSTEQYLNCGCQ